jgi:hypothetical protein
MRVNAELVVALRKRKSWSQDELADADDGIGKTRFRVRPVGGGQPWL